MKLKPNQFIVEVNCKKPSVLLKCRANADIKSLAYLDLVLAQGSLNICPDQLKKWKEEKYDN